MAKQWMTDRDRDGDGDGEREKVQNVPTSAPEMDGRPWPTRTAPTCRYRLLRSNSVSSVDAVSSQTALIVRSCLATTTA